MTPGNNVDDGPYDGIMVKGLLFNENDEALFLLRSDTKKYFPGMWDAPGGKGEEGESPEDTIAREFTEETGLIPKHLSLYHTWTSSKEMEGKQIRLRQYNYIIEADGIDRIVLEDSFRAYAWRGVDDIPEPIAEDLKEALKRGFAAHLQNTRRKTA